MCDHTALGDRAERVHVRLFPLRRLDPRRGPSRDRRQRRPPPRDLMGSRTPGHREALEAAGAPRIAPTGVLTPRRLARRRQATGASGALVPTHLTGLRKVRTSGYTRPVPEFGSILTAMVTPFDEQGRVDEEATVALMRHLVANGSDGVVLSGTTGEASTLTDPEKIRLFELGMETLGGTATVIAGTGSNDTAHSVHLTKVAAEARRGRGAGGHAVLQPAATRGPVGACSRDRRRRRPGHPLQHPDPVGRQHAAGPHRGDGRDPRGRRPEGSQPGSGATPCWRFRD